MVVPELVTVGPQRTVKLPALPSGGAGGPSARSGKQQSAANPATAKTRRSSDDILIPLFWTYI
jgi:hypothetical protein